LGVLKGLRYHLANKGHANSVDKLPHQKDRLLVIPFRGLKKQFLYHLGCPASKRSTGEAFEAPFRV